MSSDQLIISRLTSGIKKLNTIKIPKEIVNIAKNLIIDISGVTFAGSRTKSASLIYNLAKETYLEGNCEIIGMKKKLNPFYMRLNFRYTDSLWIIISLCNQCKQNSPKPNSVRQIHKNWVLHVAEKDTFLPVNIPSNVHSDLSLIHI